jgi:hypothetical protein
VINEESIEATIRGIATALESPDAQGEFLRGEVSFLINNQGITLLRQEEQTTK